MPKLVKGEAALYGYSEEEWASLHKSKRWRVRNPGKQWESTKRWLDKNPEYRDTRHRKYQLKKYDLTEESYKELLEKQQFSCAICERKAPDGKWKVFAVDHDHSTGEVRGLLCTNCNLMLGNAKDNINILQSGINYLEERKSAK